MQVKALFISLMLLFGCVACIWAQPKAGFNIIGVPMLGTVTATQGLNIKVCTGTTLSFHSTASINGSIPLQSVCYLFQYDASNSPCGYPDFSTDPTETFTTLGKNIVMQVATDFSNPNKTDTIKMTVEVVAYTNPNAGFSEPYTAAECGSDNFTFKANTSGLSYFWTFDSSSTAHSTQQNATVSFDQAFGNTNATCNVTLVVTDAVGCMASNTKQVPVSLIPYISITSPNSGPPSPSYNVSDTLAGIFTVCVPASSSVTDTALQFINNSATFQTNATYSINWDGVSTSAYNNTTWPLNGTPISHKYQKGFHVMTVTVTGNLPDNCANTKKYGVFVGSNSPVDFGHPPNTNICVGDSLKFPMSGYINNANGTFYVISINELPAFQDTFTNTALSPSGNDTFTHVFNYSSCGILDPTYPNSYTVSIAAINACGTSPIDVKAIYVSGKPQPLIKMPISACIGTPVNITNNTSWSGILPACSSNSQGEGVWEILNPSSGGSYTLPTGTKLGTVAPWSAGDQSLNVTFKTAGTYTIRLHVHVTAQNAFQCATNDTVVEQQICVRNLPVAKFTLNKKIGCAPDTIIASHLPDVNLACSGDSLTWTVNAINEGNCPSSATNVSIDTGTSAQMAKIVFPQPGQYQISLNVTVKGGGCDSTFFDTITVYGKPSASISLYPSNAICSSDSIQATAQVDSCFAEGPITYRWIFTGAKGGKRDTIYALNPPFVTFNASSPPGGDSILFAATSGCGTVYDTAYLTVAAKPVLNKINNKTICSGSNINIILTSSQDPLVNYSWTGTKISGDVVGLSSTGNSNTITDLLLCTTKSIVEYDVIGFFSGGTCQSDIMKIFDTIQPAYNANAGPDQFLCRNITSTTLAATSPLTGFGTWSVVGALPAIFNKNNPTTTVSGLRVDTVYAFVWTISNTGLQCVDSTDTVIVSTKPIVNLIDTPSTICPGQQLVIYGEQPTGSDSTTYTYQWQQSSDNTTFTTVTSGAALNSLTLPPLNSNNYYRRIVSSHSCSDTSNVVQVIVVTEIPQPTFTPHDTSACAPPGGFLSVTFSNNTPDKNKFTFTWSVGNNQFSNLTNPVAQRFGTTFSGYGDTTYYVTLAASNGCSTVSFEDSVKVKSQPAVIFSAANVLGCSAAPITFTNLSVSGAQDSSETYIWYFGDGSTDTTNNRTVTHIYHNGPPTTYSVILTGSNECGVNTSQPLSVTIDSNHIGLHVDINSTERFICANDTVHFQNKSSGATSFTWNFGDGDLITTTNNIEIVPHLYKNTGVYYASVCAINYCMSDTCTYDTITVGARPSASFNALPDTVCAGQTVQFNNTSTPLNDPGIIFTWNFGDGSAASNDGSPAHAYLTGGIDTAWLIASRQFIPGFPASFSCPDSAFAVISVDQPEGVLTYTADTLCQGQAVTFTVKSNSASHYKFVFGDGASADINGNVVTHTYTQPGAYLPYVMLTGFSGKCFNTIAGADTVRVDSIQASFLLDSVPICDTTTLKLTDNSYAYFGIQGYAWVVNGTAYTGNTASQAFTQTGTYDVRLMVTGNSGCTSSTQSQLYIYVHQTPAGAIAVSADTCARDSVYFSASVFSNDPIEYLWDFGNGAKSSGKDAATVFNPPGDYTVTLTALTNFGCSVTLKRAVVINTTPDLSITPVDTVRLCRGDTLQLNATGNNIVTWGWGPVDGLSCTTCANPLAYPTATTLYTVTGTNGFGCTGVDSVTVNVIQPITVSATPSSVSICLPDSLKTIQFFASGAYNYTWSPSTWLDNSNIFDPTVTIPQDSIETSTQVTYTVTGYDQYHCSSNTASVVLSIGLTPVIDLGVGDTGVAGRTVIYQPKLEKNGPFKSFTWSVLSGYGSANCLNGVCDSVQLTINGDVTFQVTAENIYGCTTTDTIHYSAFCNQNEQVFIPTGFSPDGDGINDVFMVQGKGIIVEQFKVFNRWGQVVFDGGSNFAPNLPAYGWNGTLNGTPVTEDVYVYIAKVKCTASNISFFTKGNVTLIRVKK